MNNTIKAIETHYKGYRFRSRLEARWAVFFDAAGIEYQYEPEGFEKETHLGRTRYLPDFYLPKSGTWVEVKATPEKLNQESEKLNAFLDYGCPLPGFTDSGYLNTRQPVNGLMFLYDIPWVDYGWVFHPVVTHSKGLEVKYAGFNNGNVVWFSYDFIKGVCICGNPDGRKTLDDLSADFIYPGEWNKLKQIVVEAKSAHPETVSAYKKARSARFEHGETPDGVNYGRR